MVKGLNVHACTNAGIRPERRQRIRSEGGGLRGDGDAGAGDYRTAGRVVKESRDRVSAAIVNSGFTMPISRLTVNLAPADQRKEGPAFDLPIAISILMASGQLEGMDLTQTLMLGELSLDGSLHPVRGALPMVISASEQGIVDIILPEGNAEEVACIQGLRVYPASSLRQVVNHLKGREPIPVQQQRQYSDVVSAVKCAVDMAQVQGQVGARGRWKWRPAVDIIC